MNFKSVFIILTFSFMILTSGFLLANLTGSDTTNISKSDGSENFPYIRGTVGVGRSSVSFGDIASLTIDLENTFFSLRYCQATKFPGARGDTDIQEFGLLVGLSYNLSFGYMSAGTGISMITKYGGYIIKPSGSAAPDEFYPFVETSHSVVGLPVQIDLFYTPFNFLGIGFSYFLNVNSVYSISGYMFCIQVGKLH